MEVSLCRSEEYTIDRSFHSTKRKHEHEACSARTVLSLSPEDHQFPPPCLSTDRLNRWLQGHHCGRCLLQALNRTLASRPAWIPVSDIVDADHRS